MSLPAWLDRAAWPWTPRWLSLPEGRLHYIDEGTGPPVVLVHGTPTWSFEWRHVIAALATRHRVLAFDHLGFGLSDQPAGPGYAPEDHAVRFRAVIDRLVPEGPVSLVVHDFGGPIALDWVLDHPDRVTRLVMVNSWMWPFDDDRAMRWKARLAGGSFMRWLYRRWNASLRLVMPSAYADRRRLTPAVHAQYLSVFPEPEVRERVLFALARSLRQSSPFFAGLWRRRERLRGVPVHIIWGMRDSAFPPALLERWREAVPEARVTRLAEAGHWPHEEQPREFGEALAVALDSRTTAGPGGRD
jgi:haloalkane dehalogenase